MRYPDVEGIYKLIEDGYVSRRFHGTHPISIFNYTQKAATLPPAEWSETLKDCRGLVLEDDTYEIVARGFKKFWNEGQTEIPVGECFVIEEKLDGSLLIVFKYNGQRIIATRGSFESDQAKAATEWFLRFHIDWMPAYDDVTYLFEWIAPENRIVVDYGDRREAVHLGCLYTPTGAVSYPNIPGHLSAFTHARTFASRDFLNGLKGTEFEGFVFRFEPSGFRVKVKSEDYVRLHRLFFSTSNVTIWEMLKDSRWDDIRTLRSQVPVDFQRWIDETVTDILSEAADLTSKATAGDILLRRLYGLSYPSREYAEKATELFDQDIRKVLFAVAGEKDFVGIGWKLVKPKWVRTAIKGDHEP